jgi:hypothetical protein
MRQDRHAAPFALELLEEHRHGKTVEELSRETGIPADRIEMRLRAAAAFLQRTSKGDRMHLEDRSRQDRFGRRLLARKNSAVRS